MQICKVNVFLLQYRGYGRSQGQSPHHPGLQQDSQAGLNYLLSDPRIDITRLFILGHSLGGAVSLDLVSRNPGIFAGLILDNTFKSIRQVAIDLMPPFGWLTAFEDLEPWDNEARVKEIYDKGFIPMLAILGGRDELFPQDHMLTLYHTAHTLSSHKDSIRLAFFPNGTHIHTSREPHYAETICDFIQETLQIKI